MGPRDLIDRMSIPVPESGCWLWLGWIDKDGYAGTRRYGEQRVHRVAYKTFVGEVPAGLLVCHKCDTRSCVNPAHLFLGTHKDNTHDMIRKNRSRWQRA